MKALLVFICLSIQLTFAQKELKHQVYFLTDQYEIPETEESRLLLFLSEIENMDIEKISIYGFCDDRGSDSYNLVLSQQRADDIKEVFSFIYKAPFDNGLTEHELDHVMVGKFDGNPKINKEEVEDYKWMSLESVKFDIEQNPQNYTEWFKIIFDKSYEKLINA